MQDRDDILARVARLEADLSHNARRARWWRGAALAAVAAVVVIPLSGDAGKPKQSLVLTDASGVHEAMLTAHGLEFKADGHSRMKLDVRDNGTALTLHRLDGAVAWTLESTDTDTVLHLHKADGSPGVSLIADEDHNAVQIYSETEHLRMELSDSLRDLGSGLELFDDAGKPRGAFYAGTSDGKSGILFTDGGKQPRIDIHAEPAGYSIIQTSDADAKAIAELSVLHRTDAVYRQTGLVEERPEDDPLLPMMYLLDRSGTDLLIMAVTPH